MFDHSAQVAVVSHDAGGAEILSSYIIQQGLDCNYSIAGPALNIFERKLGPIDVVSLEMAIQQSDWLLCGTSWQSDLEWLAINIAKKHGKRTVAFLDHWAHYRTRFIRAGKIFLPDEIWVGDTQAEVLAQRVLPEVSIKQVGNPYFEDLKRELATLPKRDIIARTELNVLFVSEPLRDHASREFGNEHHWGYTEEEALHYFLSNLHVLGHRCRQIVIRPHPSEPLNKYDWVTQKYNLPIVNGGNKILLEELAESDVVVGFQSMAMIISLLAGKRVISCIPPGGEKCVLPQPEIEHMQALCSSYGEENY